MKFIWMK